MAIQPDGRIIVAGNSGPGGNFVITRYFGDAVGTTAP
jgi:hypothetical protein